MNFCFDIFNLNALIYLYLLKIYFKIYFYNKDHVSIKRKTQA